jgi:hypothetical protein
VCISLSIYERKIFRTKVVEESETHTLPVLLTGFEVTAQKCARTEELSRCTYISVLTVLKILTAVAIKSAISGL